MVSLQQEAGEARGEYLHFSGISHWNQHYHWNNGLSSGRPCQGLQRSRVYFCPGLERGWRRSGDGARGALGIACPATVCATCPWEQGAGRDGERGWAGREAAPPHWILSLGSACPGHPGGELPGGSLTLEPLMLSLDLA